MLKINVVSETDKKLFKNISSKMILIKLDLAKPAHKVIRLKNYIKNNLF